MSKKSQDQLEIQRLKNQIKVLEEQLNYKQKLINTRDRRINNMKIEFDDKLAKELKKFDNFIEVRKNEKAKTKEESDIFNLTDYTTVMEKDNNRIIRLNVGNKQLKRFTYVSEKDGILSKNNTLIQPEQNIYFNLTELLEKVPTNWAKKDINN
jgi:hypothetical protein